MRAIVVCVVLAMPAAAAAATNSADPAKRAPALASERGCTLCHRAAPSKDERTPLAPSFREIAARYRGDARAESRLVQVVLGGADPKQPHWKDRHEFTTMGANAPRVSRREARALVRWILETPR